MHEKSRENYASEACESCEPERLRARKVEKTMPVKLVKVASQKACSLGTRKVEKTMPRKLVELGGRRAEAREK